MVQLKVSSAMKLSSLLLASGFAIGVAGCSSNQPAAEPTEQPTVTVTAEPSSLPPSVPLLASEPATPNPARPATPACGPVRLGGHFEGEGLTKRWVDVPIVNTCDTVPPALTAGVPATALPPIVATPAD
jgi:hypothetical protein